MEDAVSAEVIALAVFSWIGEPDGSAGVDAVDDVGDVFEVLRVAVLVEIALVYDFAGDNGVAALLPVCGPAGIVEGEGQTAGRAQNAGELPAPNEGIGKVIGVACQ